MRHSRLLLALLLSAPARAAVLGEAAPRAPLSPPPILPPSAVSAAPSAPVLTVSASLTAPDGPLLAPSASLAAPAAAPPDAPAAAAAAAAPAAPVAASPAPPAADVAPRAPITAADRAEFASQLNKLFARLDASYPLRADSPTGLIRARVRAQLLAAVREYAQPEIDLLKTVARDSDSSLAAIQERLDAGEIDPSRRVRLSEKDPEVADAVHARIAVYPVAADPFQWGHLLAALRAVGELGVDKVVFVLAGDDPRKPKLTPVAQRHPMGRSVLADFAPFFEYSPIAVGTTLDGETNIFRLLALNPGRRVDAWYMVGDDHYRLVNQRGDPDTLPKLEANLLQHGQSLTHHALKVAFIQRELTEKELKAEKKIKEIKERLCTLQQQLQQDLGAKDILRIVGRIKKLQRQLEEIEEMLQNKNVPSTLDVSFLKRVPFDASSTSARDGRHTLMPYSAYDQARRIGLYSLTPAGDTGDAGDPDDDGSPAAP